MSKEPKSQKPPPLRGGNGKNNPSNKLPSNATDPYGEGYDFLLINREMNDAMFAEVMSCVTRYKKNSKLVFILITYGGLANPAYRTARYLQSVYDEIVAFVPSLCKSAGTLMVTAAHSVIISPFGEIGPLDVQLLQKDELFGRRSGLTTRSALSDLKSHSFEFFEHFMTEIIAKSGGAVTFRLAAELSANAATEVMSHIYEQINPDSLGQDFRDLNIAMTYGLRLSKKFENIKAGGVHRLVYDYPSHDFVIDLEEAKEIFERVNLPTQSLFKIMGSRVADCMLPRSRKPFLVEMLTKDGQALKTTPGAPNPGGTHASSKQTHNGRNPAGTRAAS